MMLLAPLSAFIATLTLAFLIFKYESVHKKFSYDTDLTGVQKFHTKFAPRVGGVAIFGGLIVSFFAVVKSTEVLYITLSILPVFLVGILEDLTKSIAPFVRLAFSFVSAILAIYTLDIALTGVGIQWVDHGILSSELVSVIITVVMIGGVSHSTNIIDGFNGLLLGYSEIVLMVFLWVSIQVEDELLMYVILSMMGSIGGLIYFNFPSGRIFTGDAGAYAIGFLLAIISLLLVKRNPIVSPWFALLVMLYPVFETLFSIYRKKFLRNMSPGLPDGIHLHMLVYKRVVPLITSHTERDYKRNATTSVFMWIFVTPFMLPAVFWWNDHFVMMLSIFLFCIFYIWVYFSIIRFKYNLGVKQ